MKSYHTLAWKEILGQKVVSCLILIAIILSTVMTTAVGQSAGVLDAMRKQQAIAIGGDRYASFVQLTEEQAQILEKDDRLSYTGRYIQLGSMDLNALLRLDLVEYWGDGLCTRPTYTKLVEGRLPENPMEIALSEDALQFLGFTGSIGDMISLPLSKALRHNVVTQSYDYEAEFVLTGITQSNYLGYMYGSILGFVGEGTAAAILPSAYLYYCMDIRTVDKKNFQMVIDDLAERLEIHELDTLYNDPYLKALGIHYSNKEDSMMIDDIGFPFLIFVGVLVVVLVLLAAGLVIYNILKIAITRRIRQYGVLRAIGAQKGQLYRIVAEEILLLCMCGIPVGMLFGFLSAKGILRAALNQLSPEMFLAQDTAQLQEMIANNSAGKWGYLLISALITLVFAFLAAAPAAHFAAKVSPVDAMHQIKSNKIAVHQMAGIKIGHGRQKIKKIQGFERYYAALNLRRNKSRTMITVLSLVMSITVFVTLQSYLSQLSVTGAESEHLGDYSVVNEYSGISTDELEWITA
ncbi:MAG: ABC transporter permease, partial [Lachnospiraceae bacterium]|nr:ABC transporter permease [Lachnospiraceae bacterium]